MRLFVQAVRLPNQVNNVLCFPFLFRGALDVGATEINEEMKLAASHAIAGLAKEQVPLEIIASYGALSFGPDYVIPTPFDPRFIVYCLFCSSEKKRWKPVLQRVQSQIGQLMKNN